MAHPMKKEGIEGHNAKLRRMTMDYGSASGPKNNRLAPTNKAKSEGPEDAVGFGADSSASKARGDKPARRSTAANPVSTYAKGGRVKHRDSGGDVSAIEEANKNQALASRARGGRTQHKGKGATHVNVIVAPQGGHPGMGGMMPPGLPAGANPDMPPPMPPPGAGAPPMMPPGAPMVPPGRPGMPMMPPGGMPPGMMPPRKRGGRVSHSDEAEDKALVKQMVKGTALKHRADGGRIKQPHMTAGAATGEGRLEKIGKKAHDAGRPQTV